MKVDFSKVNVKKVVTIVTAVAAGVAAITNSLSEQKKNEEFEALKKTVAELTKGEE